MTDNQRQDLLELAESLERFAEDMTDLQIAAAARKDAADIRVLLEKETP